MARLVGGSRHGGTDGPLGLDIRDFGPIERASVRLRPLTVFIGPNNSGKSYAARLLHSVVATLADLPVHAAESGGAQSACRRMVGRRYDGKGRQARLAGTDSQRAAKALIEAAFCEGLRSNLERNFETTAAGLVRAGRARSTLAISEGGASSRPRLGVAIGPRDNLAVTAGFKGGWGEIVLAYGRGMCTASIFDGGAGGRPDARNGARAKFRYAESDALPSRTGDRGEAIPLLSSALADAIARDVQYGAAHDASFYLPAGRSAIMQTYKELAAGLVAGAPRSGSDPGSPRLQGAVADLVAELIRLGGRKRGDFFGLARRMEREMLSGSVQVSHADRGGFPSVLYHSNGSRLPLPRASSSVSELAPLSLYLKHVVGNRSMLVVEEPEAHLHPANEVILAKYVVRLVRRGLCVVLTTHSPYILEKLAKYTLAGGLAARDRVEGPGYKRDDYLAPDEVSAYLFKGAGAEGGCRAVEIERDDEFGISQEEFTNVDVELNRESVAIHDRMSRR